MNLGEKVAGYFKNLQELEEVRFQIERLEDKEKELKGRKESFTAALAFALLNRAFVFENKVITCTLHRETPAWSTIRITKLASAEEGSPL